MKIVLDKDGKAYQYNELVLENVDNEIVSNCFQEMPMKERLLKAKSMIMVYKPTNKIMFELNLIHAQHFYPLSIVDYANAMKNLLLGKIDSLPILSLDSHDYNFCDFNCKDCLAVDTRTWAAKELGFTNYDPEEYEKCLTEIARYSKKRGCDSIRFEMSGEGNPDMYPHRARIIKFAKEKLNMKCVYISSGSRLNEETIDALAKYAYYVRISLPGLNNKAYDIYSNQKGANKNKFTFDDALELMKKLVQKRKEYNREGELVIGARTCMRPENEGSYLSAAKAMGEIGIDSFQIVKILIPMGENIEKYKLSKKTINELETLNANYQKYNLMHVQIPYKLDYIYYDRKLEKTEKPSHCYSSYLSPILYGPHLVVCTHWEKIKDVEGSHYGKISGKKNQLEDMMFNEKACRIRDALPNKCSSCCSIYDNLVMEMVKTQLLMVNDIENIEFLLTY